MVIYRFGRRINVLILLSLLVCNNALSEDSCLTQDNKTLSSSQIILQCKQIIQAISQADPQYLPLSISLSTLYKETGDLNSAQHILLQLMEGEANISEAEQITILRQSGIIYFQQRRYEEAFNVFETALTLALSLNDARRIALGYNDLANIYHAYGDLDTSAKLLLKSYELHSVAKNEVGQASILHNLGSLYKEKGEYDEAIMSYRNAYSLYTELGKNLRAAQTLSNLGETFNLNGQPDKAIELLEEAASSLKSLNSYRFLADIYVLLSEISIKNDQLKEALQWMSKAKTTQSLLHTSQENPKYWFVKGLIWEAQQQPEKALASFEKAFAQISKNKEYKLQKELYTAMAKLSEKTLNYQASSRYWQEYADTLNSQLSLKDAINSKHIRGTFTFEPKEESNESLMVTILLSMIMGIFFLSFLLWKKKIRIKPTIFSAADTSSVSDPTFIEPKHSNPLPSTAEVNPQHLREDLVELMHLSLQIWEASTQTGKLELAQQSKIWSVGIDDGRLRARAMERYFGLNTLPQNPRWRSVVRTSNYVLQRCPDPSLYREELESKLKHFQDSMKRKAIINSKANSLEEEVCR